MSGGRSGISGIIRVALIRGSMVRGVMVRLNMKNYIYTLYIYMCVCVCMYMCLHVCASCSMVVTSVELLTIMWIFGRCWCQWVQHMLDKSYYIHRYDCYPNVTAVSSSDGGMAVSPYHCFIAEKCYVSLGEVT
jgi:hypothetical protein